MVYLFQPHYTPNFGNLTLFWMPFSMIFAVQTELSHHAVPSVLTGKAVLENIPAKLPICEQPGVRGDPGTKELKLQAAVKIDPKAVPFRFSHRGWNGNQSINTSAYWILDKISISGHRKSSSLRKWGINIALFMEVRDTVEQLLEVTFGRPSNQQSSRNNRRNLSWLFAIFHQRLLA